MANAWTGRIVRQAVTGEWVPWGEWLADAWDLLPGSRAARRLDRMAQWFDVREAVLLSLSQMGLEAEIRTTHEPIAFQLEDHFPHLAGLVHVHPESDFAWCPPIPPELLVGSGTTAERGRAMYARHGLLPAAGRVPTGLRRFCGQTVADPGDDDRGLPHRLLDHRRSWITPHAEPVLSVEPPSSDPTGDVERLRELVVRERLPLVVEGPYAGVWSDAVPLLFLRHDGASEPLPAEFGGVDDATRLDVGLGRSGGMW